MVTLVLAAGMLALEQASSADPSTGVLGAETEDVTWSHTFSASDACQNDVCDQFLLTIDLPAGIWDEPGGVQVGIHFPYEPRQSIDLRVYSPESALVAQSDAGDTDTQSVLLDAPANGTYRVAVVNQRITGSVTYLGLAQVERPPPAEPARDLLPNLRSLPQRNVGFPDLGMFHSCRQDEVVDDLAMRCLRFDQIIANVGVGPLELRYQMDLEGVAFQRLNQRVYRSDGGFYDRFADTWEYHLRHQHFHYKDFAQSRLWSSDSSGARLGAAPLREGDKNGFCLIDVNNVAFGERGDAARTYVTCPNGAAIFQMAEQVNGISAGWADVYNYFLPDQYLEVTGVQDGYYLLETIADPAGTVLESDETDNSGEIHIRICGDQVDIVGRTNDCSG
jgi:hypothetical protein